MRIGKIVKKFRVAVVVGAMISGFLTVPMASPASAGTCTTPRCGGRVWNGTGESIAVTNCWTSGATVKAETHPCMKNGWNLHSYEAGIWLSPYEVTESFYYYYDTDGFRVDARCKVTGEWNGGGYFSYDRRNYSSSLWVKIDNWTRADIKTITCLV